MKVRDFLFDKYFVFLVVGIMIVMTAFEKIIEKFTFEYFLLLVGISIVGGVSYAAIIKIRHLEERLKVLGKSEKQ